MSSPHGQKTFNGVALLSKLPFEEDQVGPSAGDDADFARPASSKAWCR